MIGEDRFIIGKEGILLDDVKNFFYKYRIEKFLVVDGFGRLKGLIIIKDIKRSIDYFNLNKDDFGCLRVVVVMGVFEKEYERVIFLVEVGVDVLVVDIVYGYFKGVIEMVKCFKKDFLKVDIVVGNVVIEVVCRDFIKVGVDVVKVGIGLGLICIMRVVVGIGVF